LAPRRCMLVSGFSRLLLISVAKRPLEVAGIAFDLDGTLLDTLPDIAEAANRMLADLGRAAAGEQVIRRYIGNGVPRLTKRLLTGELDGEPPEDLFAQALPLFEAHYRQTLTCRSIPFPGVLDGLRAFKLAGLKLACVTNKPAAFTEPLLASTGLSGYFDVVLSGDSLPHKKPDPAPLLYCARRLGVEARQLLVIGDSVNDVQAARAAGCPVFCVPYGYLDRPVRELDCDAIVGDLLEAYRLITRVQ
jgi:phosphoglycolate phosphatase